MASSSGDKQADKGKTQVQAEVTAQALESTVGGTISIPAPLVDPPERTPTTLTQKTMLQICSQFGIPAADALLPSANRFAHAPPQGYVTVNRQMLTNGGIPPFSPFIGTILRRLAIAPSQLHPNGYATLLGLYVLFMKTFGQPPSFEDIRHLCYFGNAKDHPSITFVRGARGKKLIMNLPDTAHGFTSQYFYVRCPAGFYSIWREGGEIYMFPIALLQVLQTSNSSTVLITFLYSQLFLPPLRMKQLRLTTRV